MTRGARFLSGLVQMGSSGSPRRGARGGRRTVETLEGRVLLAAFTVNTVVDTVDANPGDGLARDAGGNTSLRAAVMEANALAGADTINLPAGTYPLTLPGAEENGGRTGDLDITGDLTVVGAGAATTVINAAGVSDRIFDVLRGGASRDRVVSLQGLTLTGGRVVKVVDNLGDYGGALRIDFFNDITVTHCVFTNNAAPRTGPNLIFGVGGAINNSGDLTIVGSKFEDNQASNSGGAIYVGGSGARTVIRDTLFVGNSAQGGGGAIKNHEVMTIDDSTFSGNRTSTSGSGQGGAIDNNGGGDLTITNSTLSGNTALFGGGISNSDTLKVFSSTIAGNTAFIGGGISSFGDASVAMKNTIIATNTSNGTGPDVEGDVQSLGHNLVGNTAGNTGFSSALGDLLDVNPQLGPLADNGGPTPTRALLPGSPAIDAGDPAGAPATDQRGRPRPAGPGVDIGAYEYEPPVIQLLAVFARGSEWTQSFKQYLAGRGLGDAVRGYRVNGGDTLPWVNANQLVLSYDQDLPAAQLPARYTLDGFRADYGATVTRLDARSVLLTLDRPLGYAGGDRFRLPDPFFGGTSDLRFNALPGDTDASAAVLANDFSEVKRRFFTTTTSPGQGDSAYSVRHDVDGSGSILANDFSEVKRRFFNALPAQQAAPASAAVTAPAEPRRTSVTRGLYASKRVLSA